MTNEEINKLLCMLDKNELENIKKYLLGELHINNNIYRQKAFEEYLLNKNKIIRICFNNKTQKFTNGTSIYIINSNFLNLNTFKLEKNKDKYKHVSDEMFNRYLTQISFLTNFDTDFEQVEDLYVHEDNKYIIINNIYQSKNDCLRIFDTEEIKKANIILNEPKYYISKNSSILKAESNIGKTYILNKTNKL